MRAGLLLGEVLLGSGTPPTAIFARNDDMAVGVLMTAMKRGIVVPDDLSVVGFDDAPIARAAWPPLTTIHQPKAAMEAAAIDILVDPRYRENPTDPKFERSLSYGLVARASTGPPTTR